MKTKTKSSKRKTEVKGYWVFRKPEKGKAPVSYYVEPYKRKKVTAKRRKILAKARHVEAEVKNPLRPGWVRYEFIEPEERVTYTYKAEILVDATYKSTSGGHSFAKDEPVGARKKGYALQYWHSKFEPTIKKATVDFLEKVPEIRAYGDVQFLSIDLYRVSGVGQLSQKNWKLLRSFDEPEDVK